jgi:hypothetical protein
MRDPPGSRYLIQSLQHPHCGDFQILTSIYPAANPLVSMSSELAKIDSCTINEVLKNSDIRQHR